MQPQVQPPAESRAQSQIALVPDALRDVARAWEEQRDRTAAAAGRVADADPGGFGPSLRAAAKAFAGTACAQASALAGDAGAVSDGVASAAREQVAADGAVADRLARCGRTDR